MSITSRLNFSRRTKLPVVLQSEMAECGLACLAMVAGYHGREIDLTTLRQRFPSTLRGARLKRLMQIGDLLNLVSRALRLETELLKNLKTPAILHWDFNHFVVLKSASRNKIVIHDPERGVRTLSFEETSKHFTGVALELMPGSGFQRKREAVSLGLGDLWTSSRGLAGSFAQIFLLALALQIFALVSPYYMQLVVDEVVVTQDADFLLVLGLGFLLLHIIKALTRGLRSWVVVYVGTHLNLQMVSNLFRHLIRLPLEFFSRRHVGDIVSRFASIDEIQRMLTTGFVEAIVDGIMVVATLIMMYVYSPVLAAIGAAAVVLYTVVRLVMYRPFKRHTEELIIRGAREDSVFLETVRAMQTLKAFGNEDQRQSLWQNRCADKMNASMQVEKVRIAYTTLHQLTVGVEYVALIWVGASIVIDGNLTIGMLYAFLSWRQQFSDQTQTLVDKFFEFRMLKLHLDRIADIVRTEPEQHLHSERGELREIKGEIELQNVSFQYAPDEPEIVSGINLRVKPGESVVLTGASGCGKTTLLKLMMGLLTPTRGRVLLDGVELCHIGLSEYRRHTASVMQDDKLLSGSISDNISFFDANVDQQRVEACAIAAHVAGDILRMPMGFQSLVGDLGTMLSGGQQQRLLLARALYTEPRILFLDEATSHLDIDNERKVNEVVRQLGITCVMVAHRQETVALADRVIRLDLEGVTEPAV